ncbi:MAG TPA: YCF48-related protein, partial [Bacteroidota bacterium]|nr:YCF48-related protein [Bacteroidota bacterium]
KTAVAVGDGGLILRTSDGGSVWLIEQSGTKNKLYGVRFMGPKLGLVVGDAGTLLRTTNGGVTWDPQSMGTLNALFAAYFTDAQRGTIVGDYGTILRTSSGDVTVVRGTGSGSRPQQFALAQNYPNPFNPTTTIDFQIPTTSNVSLTIYDLLGREIARLVDDVRQPGFYTVRWNASAISGGVYFYRMAVRSLRTGTAENFVGIRKMLLLK